MNCTLGDIGSGKLERIFGEEKESGAYKTKSQEFISYLVKIVTDSDKVRKYLS